MWKAPPDGSKRSFMHPKPLLSILGDELGGIELGKYVCLWGLATLVTVQNHPISNKAID